MVQKVIPWWESVVGEQEKRALAMVIDSNFLNDGDWTRRLESQVADLCGVPYAVGITSGTAALALGLMACGVGQGDEVIVPDFTFIATANAVRLAGARPVLVDIRAQDLTIDPDKVRKAITRRTKAVIPVHVNGRRAPMEAILEIARKKDLRVIEDAAEALGSSWNGRALGREGDAGCFSFAPSKIITTGQGGMVVTRSEQVYRRLRQLKDQGREFRGSGGDDLHPVLGFNFKLSNLQAAVGVAQFRKLRTRLKKMKSTYQRYAELLSGMEQVSVIAFDIRRGISPQWIDIRAKNRDGLAEYLLREGIETRKFWHPLHTQAYLKTNQGFPVATEISRSGIWLPSSINLQAKDIERVCGDIKSFYRKTGAFA